MLACLGSISATAVPPVPLGRRGASDQNGLIGKCRRIRPICNERPRAKMDRFRPDPTLSGMSLIMAVTPDSGPAALHPTQPSSG